MKRFFIAWEDDEGVKYECAYLFHEGKHQVAITKNGNILTSFVLSRTPGPKEVLFLLFKALNDPLTACKRGDNIGYG